ncbi:MAG: TRAP transporter substrate-binding protein DctP [Kiritimatiellae bacterium]|jgi:TRAP-type C4-dicarboxylate transport system substrate-binding protein|nr:TRAP transporter substrate-binding protein DctP [Kiritimatiellia bacterium]MDD4341573.1 TRAP transporter substrate-binding protein DctP [Kiritimatiellia bacterium]MDY0149391.1 TRAP transporter substrate-binding protein DctP [Kiritimatiellia bacterium]
MTIRHFSLLFALAIAGLIASPASAQVRLNLATMAPDGSIWMQALNDAKDEIAAATGGEVKVRIYPGGIMGSEQDVLFKIRSGQLHGGGFMGYAISKICPDASALMFPLTLRNHDEVDAALDAMREFLAATTRENGFEVMGWTEVGFSYAYSMKPFSNLNELRATKVWGLDSPMLIELFSAANIPFIPANVTDVLPSLQTGALETVFGPPTAAVAVQWHTRVRYYYELALTYSIGGVFLSSAGWQRVPAQHQEAVKAIFDKHCRLLTPKVRKSDADALDFMRQQGIEAIPETAEGRADFERVAALTLEKIKGTVFSADAWDLLQTTLKALRGS